MLYSLSGRELAYWQAYERNIGPLDNSWRDEMLSQIADLIQYNTYITGGVGQAKKNPASKPQEVTRPWEIHQKAKIEHQKNQHNDRLGGELILEEGESNPWL